MMTALAVAWVAIMGAAAAQAPGSGAPDPLIAALTPAPATLETPAGRAALLAALTSAQGRSDLDDIAYAAAMSLGAHALSAGDYPMAHRAWDDAAGHSGTTPVARAVLLRSRAHTGDAVTTIFEYGTRDSASARDQAYAELQQVAVDLYPYAILNRDDGQLTPFQEAYAEAIGWRDAGRARYTPQPTAPMHDINGAVVCPVRWHGNNDVLQSLSLAHTNVSALAVFRILTDDSGAPTKVDVAYAQTTENHAREMAVISRLHAQRATDAPANCVMPHVLFQSLIFAYGPY
jgi:hypothetical protein